MNILCATKNSPPEAVGENCSQSAMEILMAMWWNSYYSKFGSEIWKWLAILGISFFICIFNFLLMLRLYSSVNKNYVIYNVNFVFSSL